MTLNKPRRMTLDLLRAKYRAALAQATASSIALEDAITISYTSPEGDEVEISDAQLLEDAKCEPGTYRVTLRGPHGFGFDGEAILADPTGTSHGQVQPTTEAARFVSSLLKEGREQVEHSGGQLREAWSRIKDLEELSMGLMRRLREVESGKTGDSPAQRELVQILGQMVGMWMGLGGPLNGERVKAAWGVLQIALRSPAVQDAIRAEPGGAEALKLFTEGR